MTPNDQPVDSQDAKERAEEPESAPEGGQDPTWLKEGEAHPAAHVALDMMINRAQDDPTFLEQWRAALSSQYIDDENRLAQVLVGTLNRMMAGEAVGDRYVLGLALVMSTQDAQNMARAVKAADEQAAKQKQA